MVLGASLADVLQTLRSEGLSNAQPYRVHHAINVGHIQQPTKNAAGRYVFTDLNVNELREYLNNPPMPGRKPK